MYANHRHFILLTLAFITFVVTTLGYAYVRSRIYTQAMNADQLAKENAVMEERNKHELEVTKVYDKLSDENASLTKHLVTQEKVVEFIEALEAMGSIASSTVELTAITPEEIIKTNKIENNYSHLKAHLEAAGQWSNLMRTLTLLENSPYSIVYDNIKLYADAAPEVVNPNDPNAQKQVRRQNNWRLTMDLKALVAP